MSQVIFEGVLRRHHSGSLCCIYALTVCLVSSAGPNAVQTPQEVYEQLSEEGYRVRYYRVPLTDGATPKVRHILRIASATQRNISLYAANLAKPLVQHQSHTLPPPHMKRGVATILCRSATLTSLRAISGQRRPPTPSSSTASWVAAAPPQAPSLAAWSAALPQMPKWRRKAHMAPRHWTEAGDQQKVHLLAVCPFHDEPMYELDH
jgi:Inositol hexakisphosphate